MKRYFLVDMENVHISGLRGLGCLTKDDEVILFMSKTCKCDRDMIKVYKKLCECKISTINVNCGLKNELDFQLVSYLGLLVGNDKNDIKYYIVSKDKGYESSIKLLSQCCNCKIRLINHVGEIHANYNKIPFEKMIDDISKQFAKTQTITDIIDIIISSNNKYDAMNKIESKYTPKNARKYDSALDIFYGKEDLNSKDIKVLNTLGLSMKRRSTCYKVLNIMKLTNDIGLVLDMIESTLKEFNILKDRVQESLQIYYS